MEALKEWLIPYIISNIIFGLSIWAAYRKPMWARIFFCLFFLWAAYFNSTSSIRSPGIYLNYASLDALPLYSHFITGYFSRHITVFVFAIAMGQLLIAVGLMLNKVWTKLACIGGIIFGLAITPLGVGSAFPSTVSMAVGFYILARNYNHDFIWKLHQYSIHHAYYSKQA